MMGYGFTTLRILILGIILIRHFPIEQIGEYAYIQSVIGIAGILSLPGIGVAISQAVANKYRRNI